MRKAIMLLSLFLILLLSACTIEINVEDESYEANAYQMFHQYLEQDIITADQFIDVVNGFTYEVIPSIVHIKMDVRDLLTFETIESYEGNGIIIEQTLNHVLVLTSSFFVNKDETKFADYDLYNFKNEAKEATLLYHSSVHGLALLQFTKPSDVTYPSIFVAQFPSISKEPVFVLGRHNNIINVMTMGFVADVFKETNQLTIQSEIAEYGLGDTIFSLKRELIGIYTHLDVEDSDPLFVNHKHIQAFLDFYQESLEEQ